MELPTTSSPTRILRLSLSLELSMSLSLSSMASPEKRGREVGVYFAEGMPWLPSQVVHDHEAFDTKVSLHSLILSTTCVKVDVCTGRPVDRLKTIQ